MINNVRFKSKNKLRLDRDSEFAWFALSALLMLCFVNGFPIWAYLYQKLSLQSLVILPVAVAFVFIFGLIAWFAQAGSRPNLIWIVIAILLAGIGLYLPDATVPSKRIHVAEYMLLAIIVRKAFSFRHSGVALLIWTALLTALLGVHDEILQGLHVQRYYGLRDMVVNAFGAMSGATLGHEIGLFERDYLKNKDSENGVMTALEYLGIFVLVTGIVSWVLFLQSNPGAPSSLWPLAALVLIFSSWFGFSQLKMANGNNQTINILLLFGAATLVVPLVSGLFSLDFR